IRYRSDCIFLSRFLVAGAVLGDSVQPREPQMSGAEGGSVTLSCSYETSSPSGVYLYWYRKYPNRAPQYILWRGTKEVSSASDTSDFAQKRFSSQADGNSTVLSITALELADTAVYHCALRLAQ
uniref:Ig-like domain-containing protein n=1 Tax=Chelonoidis abingdonii TaxID=106734 RepID=A0A8C0GV71_CHEAB